MTAPRLDLAIDDRVLARYPECRVGGFLAAGLREAASRIDVEPPEELARALAAQGLSPETLSAEPRLSAWREAIGRCGLKPSAYKGSAEQLAGRLLRGGSISTPLPLVNAYGAVSVRHLTPVGAYDLARLPVSAIDLREARETDSFQPLGASPERMPLRPAVVVYASGPEVICWAFNHRDSALTCLRPETDAALFLTEAVAAVQMPALEATLEELATLLAAAGAAAGPLAYADAGSPRVRLSRIEGNHSPPREPRGVLPRWPPERR